MQQVAPRIASLVTPVMTLSLLAFVDNRIERKLDAYDVKLKEYLEGKFEILALKFKVEMLKGSAVTPRATCEPNKNSASRQ